MVDALVRRASGSTAFRRTLDDAVDPGAGAQGQGRSGHLPLMPSPALTSGEVPPERVDPCCNGSAASTWCS